MQRDGQRAPAVHVVLAHQSVVVHRRAAVQPVLEHRVPRAEARADATRGQRASSARRRHYGRPLRARARRAPRTRRSPTCSSRRSTRRGARARPRPRRSRRSRTARDAVGASARSDRRAAALSAGAGAGAGSGRVSAPRARATTRGRPPRPPSPRSRRALVAWSRSTYCARDTILAEPRIAPAFPRETRRASSPRRRAPMAEHPPSKRAKVDPAIARFQSAIFNLAGTTAAPVATSLPRRPRPTLAAAAADDGARRAARDRAAAARRGGEPRVRAGARVRDLQDVLGRAQGAQDGERGAFNLARRRARARRRGARAAARRVRRARQRHLRRRARGARDRDGRGVAHRRRQARARRRAANGAALCVTGAQDNNGRWTARGRTRAAARARRGRRRGRGAGAPLFGGVVARASGADRKSEATLCCPFFSIARRARARGPRARARAEPRSRAARAASAIRLVPAIAPDKEDAPDEDGDIRSEAEAPAAQGFRRDAHDATGGCASAPRREHERERERDHHHGALVRR